MNRINKSKKEGKDQESIQSSTTPDPGYQWEVITSKREPRGQPFKTEFAVFLYCRFSLFLKDSFFQIISIFLTLLLAVLLSPKGVTYRAL